MATNITISDVIKLLNDINGWFSTIIIYGGC